MIKRLVILFTVILSVNVQSQEAIQQWVYNTLERAQLNVDKGNLEAAEKIYYDYATSTYSSKSYDHFVILRTYGYFLLQQDRNEEALKYLKLADQKRKMPPMDVFNLKFILGQIYYTEGQKEQAKKFLGELGNPYDVSTKDTSGKQSVLFGIYGIPESILIDKQLIVIKKFVGPLSVNDLNYIKEIIK